MMRLTKQYWCSGCRKVAERLWAEEGVQCPHRHKRRKRRYHKDSSTIRLRLQHFNHIWSVDFVHDTLSNGRLHKMLAVLGEYSREAICVAVKPKMNSADVPGALYMLILRHGMHGYICAGNSRQ